MTAPLDYLTPPEAAQLLRVQLTKLRGWIARGELPASDVSDRPGHGRPRYRIARTDLDAFLERRQAKPVKRSTRRRRDPEIIEFY